MTRRALLPPLLLSAWLASGCALGALAANAPPRPVRQRAADDCAVAALAMAWGRPYADAALAFARAGVRVPPTTDGLVDVARSVGLRVAGGDARAGFLSVAWCRGGIGHVAYVRDGIVYDPDPGAGVPAPVDAWLAGRCVAASVFVGVAR